MSLLPYFLLAALVFDGSALPHRPFQSRSEILSGMKYGRMGRPKEYTPEEKKCFQQVNVFYKGSCWDLLRKGPCGEGEWLVLDAESAPDVKPKCQKKPCPNEHVMWADDGLCRPLKDQTQCLKDGTTLSTDPYGQGSCECISNERTMFSDGTCYFLYRRGPCRQGLILIENNIGEAVCQRDPCFRYNTGSPNATYVLWRPNGQCYPLSSQGPCEVSSVLRLNPWRRVVDCIPESQDHFIIDVPSECDGTDQEGNCANRIQVEEQGEKYLNELIKEGKKLKRKG